MAATAETGRPDHMPWGLDSPRICLCRSVGRTLAARRWQPHHRHRRIGTRTDHSRNPACLSFGARSLQVSLFFSSHTEFRAKAWSRACNSLTLSIGQQDGIRGRHTRPRRPWFSVPPRAPRATPAGRSTPTTILPRPTGERDDVTFIKRIVAVPGDTLSVRDGHAVVNGKLQREDYSTTLRSRYLQLPRSDQDSAETLFHDGRQSWGERRQPGLWGPVPEKWIVGQVLLTYWPPTLSGSFRTHSSDR